MSEFGEEQAIVILDQQFGSLLLKQHLREHFDSTTINKQQYVQLFKLKLHSHQTPKLLFRATRDSFAKTAFHQHVDNHKHLIVIVESMEGDLFGAFTTATMNCEFGTTCDKESFAFRFENSKMYQFRLDFNRVAISLSKYESIYLFAFNALFWIGDNANVLNYSSSFQDFSVDEEGNTHSDKYMVKEDVIHNKEILTNSRYFGGKNFLVKEIEVFTIE